MEYNSQLYTELLEYDQALRAKGESLRKKDKISYLSLLRYSVLLSDHIHWQNRYVYWYLIHSFLTSEINAIEFTNKFLEIHDETERHVQALKENTKKLKILKLNSASVDFSKWTSDIAFCCDEFEPNLNPHEEILGLMNEDQLRTCIEEISGNVKKYL